MVVRIVISGVSRCEIFAEICLVADYLSQNLPNFCWERIEKSVLEWKEWLTIVNVKNKWYHIGSPLVWKEMLHKGSKPFYIGGASEFLEYCHSYYNLDSFLSHDKLRSISSNFVQFQKRVKHEINLNDKNDDSDDYCNDFVICITGAGNPLAMHLISGLLEMGVGPKHISRIYLHDNDCQPTFMEFVEQECRYIYTSYAGKVVKYAEKIGSALSYTDLLIILDYVPFSENYSIGEWLFLNHKKMCDLSLLIDASAKKNICIIFPNIGPACYNATVLANVCNIQTENIVVATSDLGLEISAIAAEIAEVPMRNMYCPPVWGFVGINQLVDIRTTVHRYNTFEPYNRYTKVNNSSLIVGSITPEFRTMEYLMYFDETLWKKVAEVKTQLSTEKTRLNKSVAVLDVVKLWLFDRSPDHIVSLGIQCNGAFGLSFKGIFSQPTRLVNKKWVPAHDFPLPKDPQMSLNYLEKMAEFTMNLTEDELPKIVPYTPCCCKTKFVKKKRIGRVVLLK